MNQNTPLFGVIRTIAAALLGYLAGKGIIPADVGGDVAAGIATLGVAIWSAYSKPAGPK